MVSHLLLESVAVSGVCLGKAQVFVSEGVRALSVWAFMAVRA